MMYYVCDRSDKENCLGGHCLEYCYHGRPHPAEGCTMDSECHIDCAKKVKGDSEDEDKYIHENGWNPCKKSLIVRCRPATKKELQMYGLI